MRMDTERLTRLIELRQEAKLEYEGKKARLRLNYHLARDLGFSAQEAKLLQGRSEDYIRDLALALPKG